MRMKYVKLPYDLVCGNITHVIKNLQDYRLEYGDDVTISLTTENEMYSDRQVAVVEVFRRETLAEANEREEVEAKQAAKMKEHKRKTYEMLKREFED